MAPRENISLPLWLDLNIQRASSREAKLETLSLLLVLCPSVTLMSLFKLIRFFMEALYPFGRTLPYLGCPRRHNLFPSPNIRKRIIGRSSPSLPRYLFWAVVFATPFLLLMTGNTLLSPLATALLARGQGTSKDELLQSRKWKLRVSVQLQTGC